MKKLISLLLVTASAIGAFQPVPESAEAAGTSASALAVSSTLPSHSSVVRAGRKALDYFYAAGSGATSDAGWRWTPYFMGVEALYRETGDLKHRQWLQAWGDRNGWKPDAPTSPTSNPDSRAAIQVWHDSASLGVNANLAPSDGYMKADLSLPVSQYWWIDSMFMGLPLWPEWAARTGESSYQKKHPQFYTFLKTNGTTRWRPGCVGTGLFDATENLWWRDCKYVAQRDSLGHKVLWARGNGWVIGAMARTLAVLPPSDPQYAEYKSMLQKMAAGLRSLQGSDGMWRSSLLSPSLYPAPETSGTALFTYAMAYGIRTGVLDRATYLPVVSRAWNGMAATALKSSGFLSNCQGVGEAPAAPSTTTSIAYCVGAFALAAAEVAKLSPDLALGRTITASAQQAGNEAAKLVDGEITTRWSAQGFPKTVVVDLGSTPRSVASIQLSPLDNRAYRYKIETSPDRVIWNLRVDQRSNTTGGPFLHDFAAVATGVRYVRLTVSGVLDNTTQWVSFNELGVYGP